MKTKIFTIGFTKTSARYFFGQLQDAGVRKLVDVRLNNTSQLAGYAKCHAERDRNDLLFFAEERGIDYEHRPELAPTQDILDAYKKKKGKQKKIDWAAYERKFLKLMAQRKIEKIDPAELNGACLLCSEDKPHHCHRRLVAEYLNRKWGGTVDIVHLMPASTPPSARPTARQRSR